MEQKTNLIVLTGLFAFLLGSAPSFAMAPHKAPEVSKIGPSNAGARFAKAIEDLPLMPGLNLIDEKDVLFVFGPNRIAQTEAQGQVDIDNVYYFYQETLPQMGWKMHNAKLYERNNEMLHVKASSANVEGLTYVRFELEPKTP